MANDFASDSDCVALWQGDNDVFATDSIGDNDWDTQSAYEDTTNYKSGLASSYGSGSNYARIADANLDAGFPLKNGDSTKVGTWCAWIRARTVPGSGSYHDLICKYDWNNYKQGLALQFTNSKLNLNWGYGDSRDSESYTLIASVVQDRWYHVGLAFDGVNKTIEARVWDDTAATATTYNNTFTNALAVKDAEFFLFAQQNGAGQTNYCSANLDEVVIFKRALSVTEMDEIRQAIFTLTESGSGARSMACVAG